MSTLKVDALSSKTTNTNLTITADGSGLVDIETGFKVSGTAGVPTADIRADAITGAKIADDAIDSEHYTDASIDLAHMSVNSIDSDQYVDGSVDLVHMSANSVDSDQYVDGSIDSAHLADDAVTLAKMASGTDGNIISYDASGNPVAIATGSDGQVLTSTGAGSPPAFEAAGGGSYTSISNTNVTAVTNIDITGFAHGTYYNYEIWMSAAHAGTDAQVVELETSTDGGSSFDTGGSDYSWNNLGRESGGTVGANGHNDGEIHISGAHNFQNPGSATNENISWRMQVHAPGEAQFTQFTGTTVFANSSGSSAFCMFEGTRRSAADVDALRFHWSSGNWTAQGKIQFLGIAV